MLIRKVTIENFRSFLDRQTIHTGTRNIIVGRNGSGKSNLLTALSTLFLLGHERRPQYNNNEGISTIELEIDNADKRFLLPASFVLRVCFRNSPEFSVNNRPVSKEELRGLLENAGFTQECFVMQGRINDTATMSPVDRYAFISRVAGVERYEDSKAMAMKLLHEENEEKVEALIDKIEMKMCITEEHKRRSIEYETLCKEKAEAEFELMNHELRELNQEIDAIVVGEQTRTAEQDEGLLEYELRLCREELARHRIEVDDAESQLAKVDSVILSQIKEKMAADALNSNPYTQKVVMLTNARDEALRSLRAAEDEELRRYIELKALKYLNAMGHVKEDVGVLEEQLRLKRVEIASCDRTGSVGETYKSMVEQRKQLWVKEKCYKEELRALHEAEKTAENKMLYLGRSSINIYETLKKENGVLGTVFSLFDVPDHLMDAFEAVSRSALFWIVVENDEIATKLIGGIDGRATFVALNRISVPRKSKAEHAGLSKLADQIQCDARFRSLLEMVCKDYFVAQDVDGAVEQASKYGIGVVTLEGDVFNRNGTITGGYGGTNQTLRELKTCKRRIAAVEENIRAVSKEIASIDGKIKYCEMCVEDESRAIDNLKAVEAYLVMKIELMKNKKISVPEMSELEVAYSRARDRIPKAKLDLETVESQLQAVAEKKARIDDIIAKMRLVEDGNVQQERLVHREKSLIDSMYMRKVGGSLEESSRLHRKHLLIDRRTHLMRKIGASDFRAVFIRHPKEELVVRLKDINKQLKSFSGFARREVLDDQRAELRQKLEELRLSRARILEFIAVLDQKKDETLNLTFSMVAENYTFFYHRLTGKQSTLALKVDTVEILFDGRPSDVQLMSGGQKTVVALALIFAVQKNDPSPFYVFDEIDANLDEQHCERLAEIIRESTAQHFISTFKPAMIGIADKCFGVISREKQSFVDEIEQGVAYATVQP